MDTWDQGYNAGLNGAQYSDNPLEGQKGDCAWAFGCSEGIKERNRLVFKSIRSKLEGAGE